MGLGRCVWEGMFLKQPSEGPGQREAEGSQSLWPGGERPQEGRDRPGSKAAVSSSLSRFRGNGMFCASQLRVCASCPGSWTRNIAFPPPLILMLHRQLPSAAGFCGHSCESYTLYGVAPSLAVSVHPATLTVPHRPPSTAGWGCPRVSLFSVPSGHRFRLQPQALSSPAAPRAPLRPLALPPHQGPWVREDPPLSLAPASVLDPDPRSVVCFLLLFLS